MAVSSPINTKSFSLGSFFSFLSSSSAKQQAKIQAEQLTRLTSIRNNLEKIFKVYEKQYKAIIDAERKDKLRRERQTGLDEETEAEKKKLQPNITKDKVISKAKSIFGGIFEFFKNVIKYILLYKVLDWISNPNNVKKVAAIVKFFAGIVKFFVGIIGFGVDRIFEGLDKLVNGGGVTRFFGLLEGILGVFTILPFVGGMSIVVNAIKMIPRLFSGLTKFFTNLLPNVLGQGAKEALDDGAKSASAVAKEAGQEATKTTAETATKAATTATTEAGAKAAAAGTKGVAEGAAKVGAKGAAAAGGKSLIKKIPLIGAIASGIFAVDRARQGDWFGAGGEVLSGLAGFIPGIGTAVSLGIDAALIGRDIHNANKKDENLPKLAKGGIITKPTKAIVGEAGPEAIIPLSKLGSSSIGVDTKELQSNVNRIVPQFIKLLLLPFTVIGAGIVSLIGSIASKFPVIGPLVGSAIGMIAGAFGIPKSLVNIALKGLSKVDLSGLGGLGDLSKLFGKPPTIKEKKKGDKTEGKEGFQKSNDDSVRGLLGDILNALIYKNTSDGESQDETKTPPPSGGATPGVDSLTPAGDAAPSAQEFGKQQLEKIKPKFGEGDSSGILLDVGNKNLQKVTGQNPGKYFYDAFGNIYAVDKDEKRMLTPEDFKKGVGGGPFGAVYFFRDVKSGKVALENHANAQAEGWYDYAANAIRETVKGSGSRNDPTRLQWVPVNKSEKFKGQFNDNSPYGKSTIAPGNVEAKPMMTGTYIPGTGSGDIINAKLERGEYVLNKNAVDGLGGPKVLDKYNFDMFPRFGSGVMSAMTGGAVMKFATGGVVSTKGIWDTGPGYTIEGAVDQQGRPIVFSKEAAEAFSKMMKDSGGKVKPSDVASSKRSPEKNRSVGGASGSLHMRGIAMDIHGSSNQWIRKNGHKYGWIANDYPGSHGGHFEFKGPGLTPSGGGGEGSDTDPGAASKDSATSPGIDWGNIAEQFKILSGALRGTGGTSDKEVKSTYPDRGETKLEPTVTAPSKPNTAGTTLNQAQSQANAASRTQGGKTTTTVVNQPSTTHAGVTTTTGSSQFSTVHNSASPYITFPLSNT